MNVLYQFAINLKKFYTKESIIYIALYNQGEQSVTRKSNMKAVKKASTDLIFIVSIQFSPMEALTDLIFIMPIQYSLMERCTAEISMPLSSTYLN
jgi:hypothetical protein